MYQEKVERWVRAIYFIITNNPLVFKRTCRVHNVIYPRDIQRVLKEVPEANSQKGHCFYHIISGSVKPIETPYKSQLCCQRERGDGRRSLSIIGPENAIARPAASFQFRSDRVPKPGNALDFQLIDWTLIEKVDWHRQMLGDLFERGLLKHLQACNNINILLKRRESQVRLEMELFTWDISSLQSQDWRRNPLYPKKPLRQFALEDRESEHCHF